MSDSSVSTPEVSIIVPAYEAARFVGATLASVQAQTISSWELILVDDGSTDETLRIAEQYAAADPRIRALAQANSGPSAARNHGYAAADPGSKYIIFLDADDLWEKDTLKILIGVLERNPDALAAHGTAQYIDADGQLIRDEFVEFHQRQRWGIEGNRIVSWATDQPTSFAVEVLMERIITAGTVLLRRKALEVAGLWNPDLRMWEDWDLWLRICLHGDIAFTNTVVLRYRRHNNNLSNNQHALETGELRIRQRLIATLKEDATHRAIALAGLRHNKKCMSVQFWCLAKSAWRRGDLLGALKWARRGAMHYWEFLRQNDRLPEAVL